MKHTNNNAGYSIVFSLLMVGFLIVVTSGVFNLVLGELNDNRGRENYLKAFAGAEGALELGLLQIKENGYGYYGSKAITVDNPILSEDSTDIKFARDALLSYNLNSKTTSFSGSLDSLGYAIIPLFILDDGGNSVFQDVINPSGSLSLSLDTASDDLIWNLLSENAGMSGVGAFSQETTGELSSTSGIQSNYLVNTFMNTRTRQLNYLILFNSNSSGPIDYSLNSSREFTKPETVITSSARVGKYRQNLNTTLDNTQFLNILRYSIYSSD